MPDHSFGKEIFPNIQSKPPLAQLEAECWRKDLVNRKLRNRYSHSFPNSLSNAVLSVVPVFLLSHVSVWGFPFLQAKARIRECCGANKKIAFDQLGNSQIASYK